MQKKTPVEATNAKQRQTRGSCIVGGPNPGVARKTKKAQKAKTAVKTTENAKKTHRWKQPTPKKRKKESFARLRTQRHHLSVIRQKDRCQDPSFCLFWRSVALSVVFFAFFARFFTAFFAFFAFFAFSGNPRVGLTKGICPCGPPPRDSFCVGHTTGIRGPGPGVARKAKKAKKSKKSYKKQAKKAKQ